MAVEIAIGIAASVAALGLIVAVRSWRLRRMMRADEISWRGALGISVVIGALAAGAYATIGTPSREVPPAVVEKAVIPQTG